VGAGKYSAGRIFLQVVPSFKGVQKKIAHEVQKANEAIEPQQVAAAEKAATAAGKASSKVRKTSAAAEQKADAARLKRQGEAEVKAAIKTVNSIAVVEARARAREEAAERAHQRRLELIDRRAAAGAQGRREDHHVNELADKRKHKQRLEVLDKQAANAREKAQATANQREIDAERRKNDQIAKENRAAERREEAEQRKADARAVKARQKVADEELREQQRQERRRGGAHRAAIERMFKGIDEAMGSGPQFGDKFTEDFAKIDRAATALQHKLDKGLINPRETRRAIDEIERSFRRIAAPRSGASSTERDNARAALRSMKELRREQDALGRSSGRLGGFLRSLSRSSDDGANAFRIFNYRILGAVTLLPLLSPLLGAAAGGLVAFGTAALGAAAGIGVMVLAFSGIGAAVKALGDVQDNAAKDSLAASKTMRNAARGVRDAEQGLASARSSAARGAQDAARRIADAQETATRARERAARSAQESNRRIADAERRLADAQENAAEVQDRLRKARADAQQDQMDLADQIKRGMLDERQALIDLFNAQVNYNSIMASGGSTNLEKEQASIDLGRAQLAIKEIRDSNRDLAAENEKATKLGIEGSEGVVDAKRAEADAQQAIKDAEEGVAEARRDAAQQAIDSARDIRDADRSVADARRDAAEQAVDSQNSIRDAQERLTDAQEAYQEALTQTGEIGSASMDKLNQAMEKLSPAGQRFARYLFSLRGYFRDLRAEAQEGMLPGVQSFMEGMIGRYGPGFQRWIGSMSTALGGFFQQALEVFTSPAWTDFFAMMEKNAEIFAGDFGTTMLNFLTGLVSLMTAFAPASLDMSKGMVGISEGFKEWAAGLKDSEGFRSFLEWLERVGPKVKDFLFAFGKALVAVGVAMAPIGEKVLDGFTAFLNMLADMDPDTLSAIVTGILGFVLASQLAAGAMQTWLTVMTPFHSPLGMIIFLLTGLAVALIWAYQHWDGFREAVDKTLGFIRDNWKWIAIIGGAVTVLGGALFATFRVLSFFFGPLKALRIMLLGARLAFAAITGPIGLIVLGITALILAFIWAYKNLDWFRAGVDAVVAAIGKVIGWLWTNVVKPYFTFIWNIIKNVGAVLWWLWTDVAGPVVELIGAMFKKLWEKWIGPALGWIMDKLSALGRLIRDVWLEYIDPILDKFGLGAADLKGKWQTAIEGIGAAWDSLKQMVFKPIEWIINTVINKGFVDNFNKLADVFGTEHISHLVLPFQKPPPASRANLTSSGGGRDTRGGSWYTGGYTGPGAKMQPAGVVHADEYVIRKESTNALRAKYGLEVLDYINRHGEIPGLGGYSSGGLVAFGRMLQKRGYQVGQHPAFGRVGRHGKGSLHYVGKALDINADGHGQAYENRMLDALIPLARAQGFGMKWRVADHYGHAHVDQGGSWRIGGGKGGNPPTHRDLGGRVMGVIGNIAGALLDKPLDYMRDAVKGLMGNFKADGVFNDFIRAVPLKLIDFADAKISAMINGNDDAKEAEDRVDNSRGYKPAEFANGGLVPDNGTMLYDNGGYLPPGLTQVLNLTGKPEPVFTADQFEGMGSGRGLGGSPLSGSLQLDASNNGLTAADVADEIMWEVTRVEHGGKYAGRTR
jgi:hypothetical protein